MPPRHRRNGSAASINSQNAFAPNTSTDQSMRVSQSFNASFTSTTFNTSTSVKGNGMLTAGGVAGYPSRRSPHPPSVSQNSAARRSVAADQVANSARGNGPVSYFLTAHEDDAISSSRRSVRSPAGSQASEDDSYTAEDAFVSIRQNGSAGSSQHAAARGRGASQAMHDNDAWRPVNNDSDGDSGAGDEPVKLRTLPAREGRGMRRSSTGLGYLGESGLSSRTRRETSIVQETATPTMSRGDGDHIPLHPVIAEEPDTPTPTVRVADSIRGVSQGPASPRRGRSTSSRRAMAEISGSIAGLLVPDTWWTSIKYRGRKAAKWYERQAPWVKALLGLLVIGLMASTWARITWGMSPTYLAPTAIPASMEDLAERLVNMEGHLQGLTKKVNMEQRETTVDLRDLRETVNRLKIDFKNVAAVSSNHDSAIKSLESDLASLKDRVVLVERDIRASLDDGRIKSALERILPRHVPVRYENGKMTVDPHFYAELKKLFVGSGEVEETVRKMIAGGVQTPKDQWSVNKYERELEAWSDRMFERWTQDSKYVERTEFIDVLHKELDSLRNNVKVSPGTVSRSPITIKTAKGEDVTAALQSLIDAALVKYSKDTLALPDYALFSSGARVIPESTSPTLVLKRPSTFARWFSGAKAVEGRQPATALYPDNSVGNCWPFATDKGTLSIMLARQVKVTSVTVEHTAHELSFDVASAPKRFEVWMSVEGQENQAKAKDYLERRATMDDLPATALSQNETPERLLLTSFDYDATSINPIQTFPVPADLIELGIQTQAVVFHIESNWGGDFTCLYRVRVHGEEIPPEPVQPISDERPSEHDQMDL